MSKFTIDLATAKKWVKTWRKLEGDYNKHHECNGFLIPLEDFKGILNEEGVVNARAYLGIKENEDGTSEEKLILVGVDANGKDMLPLNENGELTNEDDRIFDFTRPCPNYCDPDSPLNG